MKFNKVLEVPVILENEVLRFEIFNRGKSIGFIDKIDSGDFFGESCREDRYSWHYELTVSGCSCGPFWSKEECLEDLALFDPRNPEG